MTELRKLSKYEPFPSYLEKLRGHFNHLSPLILRQHKVRHANDKGCWVTTILPSMVNQQLKISGTNSLSNSMFEVEFAPSASFECEELRDFLTDFDLHDSIPLILVNSVKKFENAHLIVVGKTDDVDGSVYVLGDY